MAGEKRRRRFRVFAACALAVAGSAPVAALGATYTVTSLADAPTGGTLREAIELANVDPNVDVIEFDPALTGIISLTSGELAITQSVTIVGPGANSLAVAGAGARAFNIYEPYTQLASSISGLTIQGGSADDGGCLFARNASLELDGVVFENCAATSDGGAIFIDGDDNYDVALELVDCVITGNTAGAQGGGIKIEHLYGSASFIDTKIADNESFFAGGGARIEHRGALLFERCSITGNDGSVGGGLALLGVFSPATIDHCTISGNTAMGNGGGVASALHSNLELTYSTLSGNDAGEYGGALLASGSTVWLYGSTVSGNSSGDAGGGLALINSAGTVEYSTLSGNSSDENGGAIYAKHNPLIVRGTILANSTATPAGDLSVYFTSTATLDYCLVETPASATFTGSGNVLDQDPLLGPLQDNYGPTPTHLPAVNSPAVDAGNPSFSAPPLSDQRGLPREGGVAVDIGAVERIELDNGDPVPGGDCTPELGAAVCVSGHCATASDQCIPEGGCADDSDCSPPSVCELGTFSCGADSATGGAGGSGAGGDTSAAGHPNGGGGRPDVDAAGAGGDSSQSAGGAEGDPSDHAAGSGGDQGSAGSAGKAGSTGNAGRPATSGGTSSAGSPPVDSEEDGGCGCEVPGSPGNSNGLFASLLLMLAAVRRHTVRTAPGGTRARRRS